MLRWGSHHEGREKRIRREKEKGALVGGSSGWKRKKRGTKSQAATSRGTTYRGSWTPEKRLALRL